MNSPIFPFLTAKSKSSRIFLSAFPKKASSRCRVLRGVGKRRFFASLRGLKSRVAEKCSPTPKKYRSFFKNRACSRFFRLKDDPAREEKTLKALSDAELSDARDILPGALSGGMKQRAALARALAFNGDLFLLDEPFSALDDALKARLFPSITTLAEDRLVLLVTHDKEDAARLGAKVLYLTGSPVFDLSENA